MWILVIFIITVKAINLTTLSKAEGQIGLSKKINLANLFTAIQNKSLYSRSLTNSLIVLKINNSK